MAKRQKSLFGEFLVKEIKNAGMSQEAFYNAVGITKPYFYDLLNAAPPTPEIQQRMIDVLDSNTCVDTFRARRLFDLAAQGRNEIPADIRSSIMNHPSAWNQIRELLDSVLKEK